MIRQILRGFMGLHILHHASKEPISGVFMMEELRRHGYNVSPGTLYPLLHKMEDMGLLKSCWKVENGKRVRFYEITPRGREVLEEGKKKVMELSKEILGDCDE
ncbi:PadR family transcriptional regulator [Palaeococcus pacificus DY20341]|uniref:PadR family transcriptional regulator n=1 Tax=Palaeococcus pacificus DY20341 TaxID=1343739 RepID=A0A075LSF2_9EURY|nr:PadR family transcriptional regulator [Palaeococcus pacificus]AIF68892.1 PadR family transcriptional regulator [Palaeococcus pacificus DY20341]